MKFSSLSILTKNMGKSLFRGRMVQNVVTSHSDPFVGSVTKSFGKFILTRDFNSNGLKLASSGADILKSFGNKEFEGNNVASAMEALANADAVCFDVDSTVIQEEGIVSFHLYTLCGLG